MERLLRVLVRLLLRENVPSTVNNISSTLRVLALRHVVVSGRELAARICVLLVLRGRRAPAGRPHLYVRRHVAHHVLLVRVLLHRVHLPDRLPHLPLNNFGLLHPIKTCRGDRSLLTSPVAMRERGSVGPDRRGVLGA